VRRKMAKCTARNGRRHTASSYFGHASRVVIRHCLNCSAPCAGAAGIADEPVSKDSVAWVINFK
jgi:hypothetical protein